jgi:IS30 family transposase
MCNFTRLTDDKRIVIGTLLNQGFSYSYVADKLNVSRNTISREVILSKCRPAKSMLDGRDNRPILYLFKENNHYMVYNPLNAIRLAKIRKSKSGRKIILSNNSDLLKRIENMLMAGKKPDVISKRLKNKGFSICKETIFTYIYKYKKELTKYLSRKKRKKRVKRLKYNQNKNRKNIKDRPIKANDRSEIGHFEADLIISKQNENKHILTLTDRRTRKEFAIYVYSKKSMEIFTKILYLIQIKIGKKNVETITFDNGIEFSSVQALESQCNIETYFADPYSSWQRGTNERHNGLLRRFFPKGSSFLNKTDKDIKYATDFWNNMERKILDYKTPNEIWEKEAYL